MVEITENELRKHFAIVGSLPGQKPAQIKQVKIMKDKNTNKSRGYGFVEFLDPNNAKQAVKSTNGESIYHSFIIFIFHFFIIFYFLLISFTYHFLFICYFAEFAGNRIFTSFTLDDARLKQQAEKLANKRREEAKKRLKTNVEYKEKLQAKKFKRKMRKLEKELETK